MTKRIMMMSNPPIPPLEKGGWGDLMHFQSNRIILMAEVAELADALGSGSSGRKAVRVQLPPSAPKNPYRKAVFLFL
jgi:hypothetical protein